MKKITLLFLFLIHCVSIHASEPQSWWERNVASIARITAATTGVVAGLAVWQWRKSVTAERLRAEINKTTKEYGDAVDESAKLSSSLVLNAELFELHMKKKNFEAFAKFQHQRKLFPDTDETWRALGCYEKELNNSHCDISHCNTCQEYRRLTIGESDAYYSKRRSTACINIQRAHDELKAALTRSKASLDEKIQKTKTVHGELAGQAVHQRYQNNGFDRFQWKMLGCTSAAVSAASLSYLFLRPKSK